MWQPNIQMVINYEQISLPKVRVKEEENNFKSYLVSSATNL